MRNGGHSSTGVCTGSITLTVWTWITDPVMPLTATLTVWTTGLLLTAGAALLPDIDHPKSTMAGSAGVVTGVLAHAAGGLSAAVYSHTRWGCDPPPEKASNSHRGLIHTWQCAVAVGAVTWWATSITPWAVPVVYLLVFAPAIRSLAWTGHNTGIRWANPVWRWLSRLAYAVIAGIDRAIRRHVLGQRRPGAPSRPAKAVISVIRTGVIGWPRRNLKWRKPVGAFLAAAVIVAVLWTTGGLYILPPGLLGVLITVGMLTHDAGDGLTRYGSPWKAGIPHRCDWHRADYLAAACDQRIPGTRIALVRWPGHHCPACDQARRKYPRCALWDRNTNAPESWVFTTGKSRRETVVTYGSLAVGAGITATALTLL